LPFGWIEQGFRSNDYGSGVYLLLPYRRQQTLDLRPFSALMVTIEIIHDPTQTGAGMQVK
jgi:hypothetical protein